MCFKTFFILMIIFMNLEDANSVSIEKPSSIFSKGYDKYKPPWKKGNPVHVYVRLFVMDIDKIDDEKMEFSIQLYIGEEWKDDRLNLTVFLNEPGKIHLFPTYLKSYLWQPDLVFDNTRDGKLFDLSLPNTDIQVYEGGILKKMSRYSLKVGCRMDFHFYPMDTQKCYMKISTLENPDGVVLLHWIEENPVETEESIQIMYPIHPMKYIFLEPQRYKTIEEWDNGNYSYLYANFTFVRRLSASLFNVYVPSTLVVLLSWISFWVNIEAVPARVTLGMTSLLTLGTQIVQARSELPSISYMTAMDVWMFSCLVTVSGALLEFAFAYQMFITRKENSVIDESLQRGKSFVKNDIRILKSRMTRSLRTINPYKSRNELLVKVATPNAMRLDNICRKAFPSMFSLFAIIYWIYYLYLK